MRGSVIITYQKSSLIFWNVNFYFYSSQYAIVASPREITEKKRSSSSSCGMKAIWYIFEDEKISRAPSYSSTRSKVRVIS